MAPRPIIVLSADCSGASLVAAMLHRWSAHTGTPSGAPVPPGSWGYRPLQELLADLQTRAGGWEWSAGFGERVGHLADDPEFAGRARQLVADMEAPGRPWLWKEPALAFLLPFWEKIWTDPLYVVVVRNPYDASRSFEKAFLPRAMQADTQLAAYYGFRWQHQILTILETLERNPAASLFVAYEQLLRSPVEQCRRLCEHLDRQLGENRLSEALMPMIEVIDPGLWHSRTGVEPADLPAFTEEQKDLYRHLQARVRGEADPFVPGRYPFPTCADEYLENVSIFCAILAKRPVKVGITGERLQDSAAA